MWEPHSSLPLLSPFPVLPFSSFTPPYVFLPSSPLPFPLFLRLVLYFSLPLLSPFVPLGVLGECCKLANAILTIFTSENTSGDNGFSNATGTLS